MVRHDPYLHAELLGVLNATPEVAAHQSGDKWRLGGWRTKRKEARQKFLGSVAYHSQRVYSSGLRGDNFSYAVQLAVKEECREYKSVILFISLGQLLLAVLRYLNERKS